jgi:phosphoribosyl 1,2-cyclic phosphodiesterase
VRHARDVSAARFAPRLTLAPHSAIISATRCMRAGERPIRIRISILASGSSGNAALLETHRTRLLFEAGIGKKEFLRRMHILGLPADSLDAILVSHEHADHASGLPQLAREWNATARLAEGAYRNFMRSLSESSAKKFQRVEYIQAGRRFCIGDIQVTPFAVPHDAADPLGFVFEAAGVRVAIVTDLGYLPEMVKQHLRGADCLVLESNHDLDMLKAGPYPWAIKQRVMSRTGHLSNHVVSEYLADPEGFDGAARVLVLAHVSENNNHPDLVRISAEEALSRRRAEHAFHGELHVASQRAPLGPFEF